MSNETEPEGLEIRIGPATLAALAEQGVALIFTRADLLRIVKLSEEGHE